MRNDQVVTINRADYRPPEFLIESAALEFDLDPELTRVTATLKVKRREPGSTGALKLDGEDLQLESIELDEHPLSAERFHVRDGNLTVDGVGDHAQLRIVTLIRPQANTELMGLYVSHGNFFTQCEAEGFRRITFFPDRPDVMSIYTVMLRADAQRYPVLLANGNLIEQGALADGRHFARWSDPFPKPSYLFALVAGRFECNEKPFRTRSGRDVLLQIWVEPGQLEQTAHAMQSLQRAIRWDEERFGLELDLDRFMVVASNDFNIGAMENKGLNIFNAKYVLASPKIATDDDYAGIEAIVGHEYFHNWTGNRVTCRDWFQLSLKEGLTVFREQEFVADGMPDASSRALRRIDDVRTLRASQFPEDAGPMAHPVRPDSYQEIANFYTSTVYEKGAEVVRMLHTLLGREGFRRGIDLYFKRNDGKAVTCDEFLSALADANARDLTQFARWYAQAGTPRVSVASSFDAAGRTYTLTLTQSCPSTPGQQDKEAFHIPFAIGLVGSDGRDLPLQLDREATGASTRRALELTQPTQTFRFIDVKEAPVPSLARGFSAPIIVDYPYADAELAFLARHDSDPFNRWEASQRLACARLLALTDACETERPMALDGALADLFAHTLDDAALSSAFKEQVLQLPSESFLAEQRAMVDPSTIRMARQFVRREIGQRLAARWRAVHAELASSAGYHYDATAAGRRALRNLALGFLVDSGDGEAISLARAQLDHADNLTDRLAALVSIVNSTAPFKADVLVHCAREWSAEPLLMNKWFQVQATAIAQPGEVPVLPRVRVLLKHPAFSISNPNNVYALVLGFCAHNPAEFHRDDGSGYEFWIEQVMRLDRLNPTVAARVARALDRWRKFTPNRGRLMRDALLQVAGSATLSRDVREIVTKALAG